MSTTLDLNNTYMYPNGYGDLGRLPWTIWADLYIEQTIKIAGKYNLGINFQVNNVTNTHNWITENTHPTRMRPGRLRRAIPVQDVRLAGRDQRRGRSYWKNIAFEKFTLGSAPGPRGWASSSRSDRVVRAAVAADAETRRPAPHGGRAFFLLGTRGVADRYFLIVARMFLAWAARSLSGSSLRNFSRFSAALAMSPLLR